MEGKTILETLHLIITGTTEIDQEAAVLDEMYRESSKNKIIARIDELMATLMLLKERLKALTPKDYENKKFNKLKNKTTNEKA